MNSIRRHLLASLLATITLALALAAYGTYRLARQEVDAVFDYHLKQLALSLRNQVFDGNRPALDPADGEFDFVIQIWSRDGTRIHQSHPHTVLPNRAQFGYSDVDTRAGRWRVFAAEFPQQVVQVAQPLRVRERLAAAAAVQTLLPFLVLMPLLAGLIWFVVGRGLAPLDRIADSVRRRTPNALEPLRLSGVPTEALPLVAALNDLLGRLEATLAAQRAFVADAAHELRTPLTALTLQVQLTERAASDAARTAALAELRRGLERATHVVQQLLTLARQDPAEAPRKSPGPVALADLAAAVAADQAGLAAERLIDLGVAASDAAALVTGDREGLRTLLTNLVDNALRYTPAGGQVDLSVGRDVDGAWLEVADSGPGIPAEERERVFDRFYRRHGTVEPGSGLGLAIVRAVADRHGARISLGDSPLGGLRARVSFPA